MTRQQERAYLPYPDDGQPHDPEPKVRMQPASDFVFAPRRSPADELAGVNWWRVYDGKEPYTLETLAAAKAADAAKYAPKLADAA